MLESVEKAQLRQSRSSSGNTPSLLSSLVRFVQEGASFILPVNWGIFSGQQNPGKEIIVRVRPATRHKCPRCWTFTREEEKDLCQRCKEVIECDNLLPRHGAVEGN